MAGAEMSILKRFYTPIDFIPASDVILTRAKALGGTLRRVESGIAVGKESLRCLQCVQSNPPHLQHKQTYGPSIRLRRISGWHPLKLADL